MGFMYGPIMPVIKKHGEEMIQSLLSVAIIDGEAHFIDSA